MRKRWSILQCTAGCCIGFLLSVLLKRSASKAASEMTSTGLWVICATRHQGDEQSRTKFWVVVNVRFRSRNFLSPNRLYCVSSMQPSGITTVSRTDGATTCLVRIYLDTGWPQVLESPRKFFAFFPGPGKSLKTELGIESP